MPETEACQPTTDVWSPEDWSWPDIFGLYPKPKSLFFSRYIDIVFFSRFLEGDMNLPVKNNFQQLIFLLIFL